MMAFKVLAQGHSHRDRLTDRIQSNNASVSVWVLGIIGHFPIGSSVMSVGLKKLSAVISVICVSGSRSKSRQVKMRRESSDETTPLAYLCSIRLIEAMGLNVFKKLDKTLYDAPSIPTPIHCG